MSKFKNYVEYDAEILGWLTRLEKRFGTKQTRSSLDKLNEARQLFYDELGYNITRRQFETLQAKRNEVTQAEMLESKRLEVVANKGKTREIYRDVSSGRFKPSEKVAQRDWEIKQKYDSGNVSRAQLGSEYGLSKSQIYRITK